MQQGTGVVSMTGFQKILRQMAGDLAAVERSG
jgi:hypothetical protein